MQFLKFPVTPSAAPSTDYEVANKKYVDDSVGSAGGGDMLKATYDPNNKSADAFNVDNHVSGTTNKVYTATEQTKLAGIAEGAEVNVNADWNASSGDAQILNKPTIPSTAADVGAVPTSRTVNNKALSSDITLSASDVGAAASSHSHSGYAQTLVFTSKSVLTTAFVSDSTYTDYDYKADVSCSGVTSDYVPTVNFNVDEAVGGNFAPVALSGTDKITIYAKEVPSAMITIPSIVCIKAVS